MGEVAHRCTGEVSRPAPRSQSLYWASTVSTARKLAPGAPAKMASVREVVQALKPRPRVESSHRGCSSGRGRASPRPTRTLGAYLSSTVTTGTCCSYEPSGLGHPEWEVVP
jgi:hypothetical protein